MTSFLSLNQQSTVQIGPVLRGAKRISRTLLCTQNTKNVHTGTCPRVHSCAANYEALPLLLILKVGEDAVTRAVDVVAQVGFGIGIGVAVASLRRVAEGHHRCRLNHHDDGVGRYVCSLAAEGCYHCCLFHCRLIT